MKMSDLLAPTDVYVDVRASSKKMLLQDLSTKAASSLQVPLDDVAQPLLKREALGSTGVGNGVAIPHARTVAVKRPFGLFVKLKKPLEFDAIDGLPVDLAFLILLPVIEESSQLGALALVARTLRSSAVLSKLRQSKTASALYALVSDDWKAAD